ncbi:hypothetical protein ACSFE6_04790 [Pseudomonas baetica]|uniref:hypothetical protein n=1 Tax=Pseudomonas baetica TaxID=674054 RepID=UPI003EEE4F2F
MTIGFNEIARRRAVIQKSDITATDDGINKIVLASIGMTASEFDAVVFQAKVDDVIQKAYEQLEQTASVEKIVPETKSTFDITVNILKAKYVKGTK